MSRPAGNTHFDEGLDGPPILPSVMFGLGVGLVTGLIGMFVMVRLTIAVLYPAGSSGRVINAVLGVVLAVLIGALAARFAATGAERRGCGRRPVLRAARIAGVVAVLGTLTLGVTAPLSPVTWVLEVVAGLAAAWWTRR